MLLSTARTASRRVQAGMLATLVTAVALALPAASLSSSSSQPRSWYDPDMHGSAGLLGLTLTATGTYVFDTNTGQITGPGLYRPPNASPSTYEVINGIGMVRATDPSGAVNAEFVVQSLSVPAGVTVTSAGTPGLALLARGDVTVAGTIDANSRGAAGGKTGTSGAGAGAGASGACQGSGPLIPASGGGGGFGGAGGSGGQSTGPTPAPGGLGGSGYGTSDLSFGLPPGSGGGGANTCTTPSSSAVGGSGGGGLALVALGTLSLSGTIRGDGQSPPAVTNQAGSGGGSGGSMLLISPHLSLNSPALSVRGGSGSQSSVSNGGGGGGGGGGRITVVADQPDGWVPTQAVGGGMGGGPATPSGTGTGGQSGQPGSIRYLPYLTSDGPATATSGQPVSFSSAPAVGMGSYTYSWDFGDGATSSEQNPSHTYTAAGTHTVTLTLTLAGSALSVSQQHTINVAPDQQSSSPGAGGAGGATAPGGGTATGAGNGAPAGSAGLACVVPKLTGLSVAGARARLQAVHCALGSVSQPRLRRGQRPPRGLVVVNQTVRAGTNLAGGTKVGVALGRLPARHRARARRHRRHG